MEFTDTGYLGLKLMVRGRPGHTFSPPPPYQVGPSEIWPFRLVPLLCDSLSDSDLVGIPPFS